MILWTIQPLTVYELIQRTDVYRCDPVRCSMPDFTEQYDWLSERMTDMIGQPAIGVKYPVWAWYKQNGRHSKPDLRRERWHYGPGNEDYTCIEIDVPDDEVVLSDFDDRNIILNDCLLSYTEEDETMEAYYETLSQEQKCIYKEKNWERVFDVTPISNAWTQRGYWVQATFWELRKEYVRDCRFFKTVRGSNSF